MPLRRFQTGYAAVEAALADVSAEDLDLRPDDGGWTAREIVHHPADAETRAFVRLRRLIAEDHPHIDAPDDEAYARRLHYDRPVEPSLAVLQAVRVASLQLLDALTPEEWTRWGHHQRLGPYDVGDWLRYSDHPHIHADQIRAAIGRF